MSACNHLEFDEIYNRYYEQIYKYCLTELYYDKISANDAASDTFIALYNKWERVERSDVIKWLYAASKYCISEAKRKYVKFNKEKSLIDEICEDIRLSSNDDYIDTGPDTVENIRQQIKSELPEKYKELFQYRYIDKYSFDTIRKITNIKYTTLHREMYNVRLIGKEILNKILCKLPQ